MHVLLAAITLVILMSDVVSSRGLVGCAECFRRLNRAIETEARLRADLDASAAAEAKLQVGIEAALTLAKQNRNELAVMRGLAALSSAGYVCEWKPDSAVHSDADDSSRHLECARAPE